MIRLLTTLPYRMATREPAKSLLTSRVSSYCGELASSFRRASRAYEQHFARGERGAFLHDFGHTSWLARATARRVVSPRLAFCTSVHRDRSEAERLAGEATALLEQYVRAEDLHVQARLLARISEIVHEQARLPYRY